MLNIEIYSEVVDIFSGFSAETKETFLKGSHFKNISLASIVSSRINIVV